MTISKKSVLAIYAIYKYYVFSIILKIENIGRQKKQLPFRI